MIIFLTMLNSFYCTFPIVIIQLVTAGIYINHVLITVPVDVINRLKAQFISHVKSICDGDGTDAKNGLSQIPLMSVQRNGGFWPMNITAHFKLAIN